MTSQRGPVVVGVDGSPGSDAAVRWAALEARRCGLPLHVVHVVRSVLDYGPALSPWPERDLAAGRRAGEQILARAAELAAGATPDLPVLTAAVGGAPVPELLAAAAGASVLVLGSRQLQTVGSFVLGSVGAGVAARATGPAMVACRRRPR